KSTVTSPAGTAGTVDVTVVTSDGTSDIAAADEFTYESLPAITAVSPVAGLPAGGTTVAIGGTGFTDATGVSFGSTGATSYTLVSGTEITATSPAEPAGQVDVSVTTPVGTSNTTAADEFTYEAAPTISALSPAAGVPAGGTTVT